MRILIGTGNPAKLEHEKGLFAGMDAELAGPAELGLRVTVDESGRTPLENARIKALAYHAASGLPTVSFDSGLFFLDLAEDDPCQPGTHVRRVGGRELSDPEMVEYYSGLVREAGVPRFGQRSLLAAYRTGYCVVDASGVPHEFQDSREAMEAFAFLLLETPRGEPRPGWPLDSLSADRRTGQYWLLGGEENAARGDSDSAVHQRFYDSLRRFYGESFGLRPAETSRIFHIE